MIGLILCGGYGKRLHPLTDDIPKSLIELKDGYTILDKQLIDFKNAGIEKVILLTGYLSEKIEKRYGSKWNGIDIEYSVEEKPLGTLNAIRNGISGVDDDIIVRNGDVVSDANLNKMIMKFKGSDYQVLIFITKMRSPYGIVEIGEERIRKFTEKPFLNCNINGGIYCLKKSVFEKLKDFETGDIERTVFPLLVELNQVWYYKEDGVFWASIDTIKDLEEIRKEFANRTDKPWGYEKILINTEKYLTKELFIREGYRTSFHYHKEKDETMYVVIGSGHVEFDDHKEYFGRNDTIRIRPQTNHTIVATENTILHEVSTPHPNDTTRIRDYYSRI